MDRIEIDRIAQYLVDQWGEKAAPHARENVEWADACSNVDSIRDWTAILRRIEVLREGCRGEEILNARLLRG
jgi:hypothetical protein